MVQGGERGAKKIPGGGAAAPLLPAPMGVKLLKKPSWYLNVPF